MAISWRQVFWIRWVGQNVPSQTREVFAGSPSQCMEESYREEREHCFVFNEEPERRNLSFCSRLLWWQYNLLAADSNLWFFYSSTKQWALPSEHGVLALTLESQVCCFRDAGASACDLQASSVTKSNQSKIVREFKRYAVEDDIFSHNSNWMSRKISFK